MANFLGTRDSTVATSFDNQDRLVLVLDTITQTDDLVGNFDSAEGNFDLGGTDSTSNPTYYAANINSSGYYYYSNTLTLDAIYDATFTINLGMISGILPVTGLPAPFISYGGSFFLTCVIMVGLINNISNNNI